MLGSVAIPGLRSETWGTRIFLTLAIRPVSGFAVIALGHPDGLDGLSGLILILGLPLDQVALGPIHRLEDLGDPRPVNLPALSSQLLA